MPHIAYIEKRLNTASRAIVAQANDIIQAYAAQGFDLTLRQLYYQFVSRGLIANNDKEYKRLGSIINDARLVGLIDWNHITDRTRFIRSVSHWGEPQDIMRSAASSFRLDKWHTQPCRPEVWIEKDALVGVIASVCEQLDVSYFSCRGYTSQSEMWGASQRLLGYQNNDQTPVILHFGDHDPSGKDMTRDITDRLAMFMEGGIEVSRLALNMDQIDEYQPPPNPAKLTDARATAYIQEYGDSSWELDALEPTVISALIRDWIEGVRDDDLWGVAVEEEKTHRKQLHQAADKWSTVVDAISA